MNLKANLIFLFSFHILLSSAFDAFLFRIHARTLIPRFCLSAVFEHFPLNCSNNTCNRIPHCRRIEFAVDDVPKAQMDEKFAKFNI